MLIGNAGPQNRRLEKHFQGAGIISGLKEGPQRESRVMTRVMKMEEKKKKKRNHLVVSNLRYRNVRTFKS